MEEQIFIEEYNKLCKKHLQSKSKLSDLTDKELHMWITGQTMYFGRSFESSIENANCHMEDRAKAEKMFNAKDLELL